MSSGKLKTENSKNNKRRTKKDKFKPMKLVLL